MDLAGVIIHKAQQTYKAHFDSQWQNNGVFPQKKSGKRKEAVKTMGNTT